MEIEEKVFVDVRAMEALQAGSRSYRRIYDPCKQLEQKDIEKGRVEGLQLGEQTTLN